MELQKHFVAFIDILGFAKYVKDNEPTPNKPLELLTQFFNTSRLLQRPIENIKITAFSDNIIVSMPAKEPEPPFTYDSKYWNFLYYINTLQVYIVSLIGVLPIRGGLTYGDFYHSGSEILFGKAMIEAYDLERLYAFYPRIIVKPKFLNPNTYLAAHKKLPLLKFPKLESNQYDPEKLLREYPVKYDYDGILFCNYLSALNKVNEGWAEYTIDILIKHRRFIISNLQETNDLNISRKYTWMKNYHNWFCEPYEEFQKFIIHD